MYLNSIKTDQIGKFQQTTDFDVWLKTFANPEKLKQQQQQKTRERERIWSFQYHIIKRWLIEYEDENWKLIAISK